MSKVFYFFNLGIINQRKELTIMLKVKVFSDFACPFCYLGACLMNRLKEDGIDYEVEWIPFELDPNAPLEGSDLYKVYPENYINSSIKMLSNRGKEYNIEYNNKNGKFNTKRAHMGGYYAKEQGKYDEYLMAMFKAYFTDSINIAHKEEINKVAASIGLNTEEMNQAIDSGKYTKLYEKAKMDAQEYKIQSVPSFIINEKAKMSGIRDYNLFKEEFLESIDKENL